MKVFAIFLGVIGLYYIYDSIFNRVKYGSRYHANIVLVCGELLMIIMTLLWFWEVI